VSSSAQQQIADLVAERRATAERVLSLAGVVHGALMARKRPEIIEKLQNEILKLRANVRSLDQQIRRQSDVG
jgi:hypothetical protein